MTCKSFTAWVMASISGRSENQLPSHVTFIKCMGYWATAFGCILSLMGSIWATSVSSVLVYSGITLTMCGVFFWLASKSIAKYEVSRQALQVEEIVTEEERGLRYAEQVDFTSLQETCKYIQRSNQTGNCLIIKIQKCGYASFEMIFPNRLDPAVWSASSLAGLEASFRNSDRNQAELITNFIAVLRSCCTYVQFQNGRSYEYDDGTIAVYLWPVQENDCPPKYTEVCDETDLPSYSDVTFIDMDSVDIRADTCIDGFAFEQGAITQ